MTHISVHSIYTATEGEGVHIGTPQVFVRFQGCAIGCVNCDSKDTWDFSGNMVSVEECILKVLELSGAENRKIHRVSITGGDPLHPKHEKGALEIAGKLKKLGFFVNIEAAGTRVVDSIFDNVHFISFDVKTPSTGVETNYNLIKRLVTHYENKAQIKSVISDKKDFEYIYDTFTKLKKDLEGISKINER